MKPSFLLVRSLLACVLLAKALTGQDHPISSSLRQQVEIAIGVNPLNPKVLMASWNDAPDAGNSNPGYGFSTNSGTNWFNVGFFGNILGADPSAAFDRLGYAYYCFYDYGNNLIAVRRSSNQGTTWDEPIPVSPVGDLRVDKPFMVIDNTGGPFNGRIYVVWKSYMPGSLKLGVRASFSTDHGVSFLPPDSIVDLYLGVPKDENRFQCAMPAIGPNGVLYVAYLEFNEANTSANLRIAKSTNGGLVFQYYPPVVADLQYLRRVFGTYLVLRWPTLAVDQNSGFVYLSYPVLVSEKLKIAMTRSVDGGGSWDSPQIIGDLGSNSEQFHPWLSVDPTGKVALGFLHTLNGTSIDQYLTESFDNGSTFMPPVRVSSQSFSSSIGRTHEYQGLATTVGYSFPVWTDTRNGNADPYTSKMSGVPTSNSSTATASGSSTKSIYSSTNSRWHTVFLTNDKLYHTYSINEGSTWTGYELLSGTSYLESSSNPSLSTYGGKLHSIYKSQGEGMFYARTDASEVWQQPFLLSSLGPSEISSTVGGNGVGQVCYAYNSMAQALVGTWYLKHGTFNTADANPVLGGVTTITSSSSIISSPAITYDGSNIPHAVWTKSGEVYYSYKSGSNWTAALNVSNTGTTSSAPSIAYVNGYVCVTWQELVGGSNWEVYYRERSTGGSWGTTQNLSGSSASSIEPFVSNTVNGEPMVVWSESISGNHEIKYSLPWSSLSGAFKTTARQSHYPSVATKTYQAGMKALAIWTDGSAAPYLIEDDTKYLLPAMGMQSVSPINAPKIGGESESPPQSVANVPGSFSLNQNYPNPFNPSTEIDFHMASPGTAQLVVFDLAGREVATLVDGHLTDGIYTKFFEVGNLANGVYMYRLIVTDDHGKEVFRNTQKMVVLK